uniref:Uncharacterized protein n=1 Tax=Rhizophora mucronata TaxID=61149 RepID=A0A2P2JL45_RHIMU
MYKKLNMRLRLCCCCIYRRNWRNAFLFTVITRQSINQHVMPEIEEHVWF